MSDYLNNISQIPSCVEMEDGRSLRGWIADLNQKAAEIEGSSDDSFSEAEFDYARTQSWGAQLNRFGDFATLRDRIDSYVRQERFSVRCQEKWCEERGGTFIPGTEKGSWRCVEPPKNPPPRPPKKKGPKGPPKPPVTGPQLPPPEGAALGSDAWWNPETPKIAAQHLTETPPVAIPNPKPEDYAINHSISGTISSQSVTFSGRLFANKLINVALRQTRGRGGIKGKTIDVVFAIDHSGSMEMAASTLAGSVHRVISGLKSRGAKEVRFGLVTFSDTNNVEIAMPLTPMTDESIDTLLGLVDSLVFDGGTEPVGKAAAKALGLLGPVDDPDQYARQVIVITDMDGLRDNGALPTRVADVMHHGSVSDVAVNLYMINNESSGRPPSPLPVPGVRELVPQLNSLYMFFQNPLLYYQFNPPPPTQFPNP